MTLWSNGLTVFVKQPSPLVIPKPALSARNLLAAGSETADSSRDKAALRNEKTFERIFKVRHNRAGPISVTFDVLLMDNRQQLQEEVR